MSSAVVLASFPPLTVALAPLLLCAFAFILLPRFSILTYDICSSQKPFEEFLLVHLYIYIYMDVFVTVYVGVRKLERDHGGC